MRLATVLVCGMAFALCGCTVTLLLSITSVTTPAMWAFVGFMIMTGVTSTAGIAMLRTDFRPEPMPVAAEDEEVVFGAEPPPPWVVQMIRNTLGMESSLDTAATAKTAGRLRPNQGRYLLQDQAYMLAGEAAFVPNTARLTSERDSQLFLFLDHHGGYHLFVLPGASKLRGRRLTGVMTLRAVIHHVTAP